jgi:hypothetical protein
MKIMKGALVLSVIMFFELFMLCIAEPRITRPSEFLGYDVGEHLTPWDREVEYFRTLDRESSLMSVESFGNSTGGREMILATLFDGDVQRNLEQVKKLSEPISDGEAKRIAESARPIIFLNCDIHSDEYEDTESAIEITYELLTACRSLLKEVMVVINPSINPDGHDIYREWYSKYRGTAYAGTLPPNYHAYVDHDLNRDWQEGNTVEIRNIWSAFLKYSPQVFIDNHMMGSNGYRMYIAPECDPVNPEVNPIVQEEKYLLAGYIMSEFERNNCSGVVFEEEFDLFFPGYGDSWPSLHNSIGCTWEIAEGRGPESISIPEENLSERAKRRSEHQLTPWTGGQWGFEDQVRYRLVGWRALLNITAKMGEDILYNYYLMNRAEAERDGAYVIPFAQRDAYALNKAINKMIAQGIEVRENESAFIVPKTSPLARTLLGVQSIEEPYFYDVTAWNYGLAKELKIHEIDDVPESKEVERANLSVAKVSGSGAYYLFNRTLSAVRAVNDLLNNDMEVFTITHSAAVQNITFDAGAFAVKEPFDVYEYNLELFGANISEPSRVKRQSVAIYSTNRSGLGEIDKGWTRLVMDEFGFDYDVITDLSALDYDVLIIPEESSAELLINGSKDYPLKNGIGAGGVKSIKRFVENGGRLLTWGQSSALLEHIAPIKAVESNATVPGSFFQCSFESDPMTYGISGEQSVFFWDNITFEGGKSLATIESLSAGYAEGFDALENKSCMARAEVGSGEIVAYAFLPQYRASVDGSFMLFFNGLYDYTP